MVHTQYEAAHLAPMLPGVSIDVVGNGIDDRSDGDEAAFRSQYRISGPIVLYIGRRDPDKGYPLVVEAFELLRKTNPNVTMVCMGPPGVAPKIEVDGIVHFDFADEQTKHNALAACTCLCVPSEGESFGLVYMEAGRYSKPVIARRLPVLEELLENGMAGLLIGNPQRESNSNRLSASELAAAMLQLINSPDLCLQLGSACRKVSDRFVWPKVVKSFETGYANALRNEIQKNKLV
jgi:glycosyltransferase involved in cell wall biosynthesis